MEEWTCPFCGSQFGYFFEDGKIAGMVCLNPDCGRIDPEKKSEEGGEEKRMVDTDL